MKILTLHANWIKVKPTKKAVKTAEEIPKDFSLEEKESLVVFTAIEKEDNEKTIDNAVKEVKNTLKQLNAKKVIVYPYAHLSSNLSSLESAKKLLILFAEKLKAKHAPFGWYKQFDISVKGHPLAELSKEIKEKDKKKEEKRKELKKDFFIMDVNGDLHKIKDYKYKKGEEEFKILVEKEALGKSLPAKKEPPYIKAMKKFGIDYEANSDQGHMRYGPDAALMFDLISEYSRDVVNSLGIPVYEIKGTSFFNLDVDAVAEHAKLFGDRLYTVNVGKKEFVLRYAACHQQFSMIKDWNISYKNLPFGAFEIADSYRLEQSGEIDFCFRTRRFYMPDVHVFCRDEEEAKKEFTKQHKKVYEEIEKLGRNYWDLYNVTEEFLKKNKKWVHELVKHKKRPILISTVPQGEFYWTINIEYHVIDNQKVPREIGTVQMDVGNAKRFGISYTNDKGEQKNPVLLHAALIGGIERYLYICFDSALKQKNPTLPLWLAPVQVRVCNISEEQLKAAEKFAEKISKENIRVDFDERNESLSKKIHQAEEYWIPYIVVVGDKEIKENKLAVRIRETGEVKKMEIKELIDLIKSKTSEYPFRKINTSFLLSKRPDF